MIKIKTPEEIEIMRVGGQIAGRILREVLAAAQAGVTTLTLNNLAEEKILAAGARPSFRGYKNYPFAACININEGVVHGFPSSYRLQAGDLLSLDLGVYYQGFHSDVAETIVVGGPTLAREISRPREEFAAAGKEALKAAISCFRAGRKLGEISAAIQAKIEEKGYNVVRDLVGHGIGQQLHEDPEVPCFGRRDQGIALREGIVLAIEVIYTQGSCELRTGKDGWTIVTADGRWGGLFERTVALAASGPIVLTTV